MATIFHRIKVWLYDNVLTKENPNDLIARVAPERTLSVNEVCESAVSRGGADISASAMTHAVDLFHKEMAFLLGDAFRVNTGYYMAGIALHGTFDSPAEHFSHDKHKLYFDFQQGEQLRRELASIEVEVLGMAAAGILIQQVVDVRTGSVNDKLTPGRALRIIGTKIKLAGESDAIGVWFARQNEPGVRVRVEMADIISNFPSEIILTIPPALPPSTYLLEICTQYSGNSVLIKEPRTATFDKILTVDSV